MKKVTLGEKIFYKLEQNEYFNELYGNILFNYSCKLMNINPSPKDINIEDSLRFADLFSKSVEMPNSEFHRSLAQEVIAILLYLYPNNNMIKYYAKSILFNIGNHRAINLVENKTALPFFEELYKKVDEELLRVPFQNEDMFFFPAQKKIYEELNKKYYSYTGPTSMGKSLLMKIYLKNKIIKGEKGNFAIIIPTKALIAELESEIIQECGNLLEENDYRVVSSIGSILLKQKHNYIFVMTPERLLYTLMCYKDLTIDCVFVDEAQKISTQDDRSAFYYKIIDLLKQRNEKIQMVFAAPNILNPEIYNKLAHEFTNEENSFSSSFSPVSQFKYLIDNITGQLFVYNRLANKFIKLTTIQKRNVDSTLHRIIGQDRKNQSIIYSNSKEKVVKMAIEYASSLPDLNNKKLVELSDTIKKEVHESYYLVELIKKGVAYHIGYLPSHIRGCIETLFKERVINTIFCTSTLLEGVNFPADNLFITSVYNGRKKLNDIDFKNLIGRVGRIKYNLYGNVFILRNEEKTDITQLEKMLEKGPSKQKLSLYTTLTDTNKKEIIDSLRSGNKLSYIKADKTSEYDLIRKFSLILLKDILEDNKSLVRESFKDYLNLDVENEIKIKYKKYLSKIDDDINVSLDQVLVLEREIAKGLEYPKLTGTEDDYTNTVRFLEKMGRIFNWDYYESGTLGNRNKLGDHGLLKWYAVILLQWIQGNGLKVIINSAINDKNKTQFDGHTKKIKVNYQEYEFYDDNNIIHRNIVISEVLKTIDKIVLFSISNYFLKFSQKYKEYHNVESFENDWYEFVEYGTTNKQTILLQRNGYTRDAANYIKDHSEKYVKDINGEIKLSKLLLLCDKEYIQKETENIVINIPELFVD